jgi:hypothetical protein
MFTLYPGISDAECIDYLTLCRECGVRSITVDQRTFNTFVRLKNSEYRFRSSKNTADVDESTVLCGGVTVRQRPTDTPRT